MAGERKKKEEGESGVSAIRRRLRETEVETREPGDKVFSFFRSIFRKKRRSGKAKPKSRSK